MSKRAAKAVFLEAFPTATIERLRQHVGQSHFLVRKARGDRFNVGIGPTETQAWRNSCARCGLTGYVGEPSTATEEDPT